MNADELSGVGEDHDERHGAIRLIFAYDGDDVRLVSAHRVDKVLPPDDTAERRRGIWAEVRDARGATLDRRAIPQGIARDVEVFPEERGQGIMRVPSERPSGAFSVLVPDLGDADHVVLLADRLEASGARTTAEMVRVPLRESTAGGEAS